MNAIEKWHRNWAKKNDFHFLPNFKQIGYNIVNASQENKPIVSERDLSSLFDAVKAGALHAGANEQQAEYEATLARRMYENGFAEASKAYWQFFDALAPFIPTDAMNGHGQKERSIREQKGGEGE